MKNKKKFATHYFIHLEYRGGKQKKIIFKEKPYPIKDKKVSIEKRQIITNGVIIWMLDEGQDRLKYREELIPLALFLKGLPLP